MKCVSFHRLLVVAAQALHNSKC